MSHAQVENYVQSHARQLEAAWFELLRIPSVSADSRHKPDVERAAHWVADQFRDLKLTTEVIKTEGHPIVLATSPAVPGAPTILVYGHYDVQPPDPLGEWISPPFEPTLRDGNVYARGATDDKGQMLTHVLSARAWMESTGALPVQLIFLIEGEEEVGSASLVPFLKTHRDKLKCDCVVISDTSQFAPGQPAITYGLRGIAYYELRLQGPKQDLHSGTFGGAVANPANALAKILAGLVNNQGQILVPGFYDDVAELSQRERDEMAKLPFDENAFREKLGVKALFGEEGYTTLQRRCARPTCDINGLWSGYQGEGAKTVLPAKAGAKFSFRLVPNQDPHKLTAALKTRITELCLPGITWELIDFHGAPGVLTPLESPFIAAAQRAIAHGFGKSPVFMREGGSIPVVATFRELLGVDTLLLGWGQDDDNTHSPNEKFCLADFHRGIRASARLWWELAQIK
jgi:succinyl-diaminopimelate desuccinylase